jgi:hypothetical protein
MIANSIFVINIFSLPFFPILSVFARTPNDDIPVIHQCVLEIGIWSIAENISETVQDALNYSCTLNSSCY